MFLQVPELGWESMMVVVTPQDVGRPTARTERAEVADGACRWPAPIFEATKLPSGKAAAGDKIYQFLVYETVSGPALIINRKRPRSMCSDSAMPCRGRPRRRCSGRRR